MPRKKAKVTPAETEIPAAMAAPEPVKLQTVESKVVESKSKAVVSAVFARERVITESSDDARDFYGSSCYGTIIEDGKVQLSLLEALYLMEKGRLKILESKKEISFEDFVKKARKVEPNFWIRYCVFKDIRNRGYIIKTALKFGMSSLQKIGLRILQKSAI
ncbi:tRNA-intron lyase [archaeon]|nr:tRNA-intron lyase [archaeon]